MNILIVDDDMLICENVRSKLHRIAGNRISCRTVNSVVEAKIALKESCPEILIIDINMPGISGLSLISYTKRCFPQVHIYVLSGYDDYQLVRQAFVNGAADYLLKPVEIQELKEKIFAVGPCEEKTEKRRLQVIFKCKAYWTIWKKIWRGRFRWKALPRTSL